MARKLGKTAAEKAEKKSDKQRVQDTVAEVVRSNVTAETKLECLENCKSSHAEFVEKRVEMQQAQAKYRADLKAAAKAGVSSKAIAETIAISKREPDEVAREFAALNEMLVLAKIPISVQLGLFPDGQSVGARVDNAAIAEQSEGAAEDEDIATAKEKGIIAGKAGVNKNPYTEASPEFVAYEVAYQDEQDKLLSTLGRGDGSPVSAAAH